MNFTHPEDKKKMLMTVIDDMTAAALDKSSQGYSQFLEYRNQMIQIIDTFMQEDKERIAFALDVAEKVEKIFNPKLYK